jgi:hypothetical protein
MEPQIQDWGANNMGLSCSAFLRCDAMDCLTCPAFESGQAGSALRLFVACFALDLATKAEITLCAVTGAGIEPVRWHTNDMDSILPSESRKSLMMVIKPRRFNSRSTLALVMVVVEERSLGPRLFIRELRLSVTIKLKNPAQLRQIVTHISFKFHSCCRHEGDLKHKVR